MIILLLDSRLVNSWLSKQAGKLEMTATMTDLLHLPYSCQIPPIPHQRDTYPYWVNVQGKFLKIFNFLLQLSHCTVYN